MTKVSTKSKELSVALKQVLNSMGEYGHTLLWKNEALTHYVLIDPVLRAIGWDTTNPKFVQVEYPTEEASKPDYADYALLREGEVVAIVEAKSWGTIYRLGNKIKKQSLMDTREIQKLRHYCNLCKINIGILTDGGAWWIFNFAKQRSSNPSIKIDFAGADKDKEVFSELIKAFSRLSRNNIVKLSAGN